MFFCFLLYFSISSYTNNFFNERAAAVRKRNMLSGDKSEFQEKSKYFLLSSSLKAIQFFDLSYALVMVHLFSILFTVYLYIFVSRPISEQG